MNMFKGFVIVCCVGGLMVGMGCTGSTSSGTEYTITPLREFKTTLPHNLASTHSATARALQGLGYTIEQNASDSIEGIVEAKTAMDRTVKVKTRRVGESSTEVLVGVSPLGDEEIARQVLNAIEGELN